MKQTVLPVEEFKEFSDLINHIRAELCLLIKEEFQLAKTEVSEKLSRLKRNLVLVVAGTVCAYTAAVFLLIGVAAMIAFGLQAAGVSLLLSVGLGAIIVFLCVGVVGYMLVSKGVADLKESLLPEKTMRTLGLKVKHDSAVAPKDVRSSDELHRQVERTQDLLGQDLAELKARWRARRLFLVDESRQHSFRLLWMTTALTVAGCQLAKHLLKNSSR